MSQTIQLYHGSPKIVPHPCLGGGKKNNDYGSGFYCTRELSMAYEWAKPGLEPGFANTYVLNPEGLSTLYLNKSPYHILNWLAVLLQNRSFFLPDGIAKESRDYILSEFLPDYENYDLIVGLRADDSYFAFAKSFLNGGISLAQLAQSMKLGKMGEQTVLKSHRAFEALLFLGAVEVPDEFAARRQARDEAARAGFAKIAKSPSHEEDIFMIDILRNKWKNDDERLF